MADTESVAAPAPNDSESVKPKSTDVDGKTPAGHGDAPETSRNVQRRPHADRRPRRNSQDRQRPQHDGNQPRRFGNPRGPHRNERNAGRVNGNVPEDVAATRELRSKLVEKFGRQGLNAFNSYLKNQVELARFKTTCEFLNRCTALSILPVQYRLSNSQVQNTLYIRRLLDRFSSQLMRAELRYSQKRRSQIERLLSGRVDSMKELYDEEVFAEIMSLVDKVQKRRSEEFLKSRNDAYQALIEEYKISADEAAEAEATAKRNEEARRQRRAEAEQRPKPSPESNDADASGSASETRVFRRGQRRQNHWRPKPLSNEG